MSESDNNSPGSTGEEWTPPSKEDWEKLNRTAEARKAERDQARRDLQASKDKDAPADEKAKKEAAKLATEEADGRWKARLIRTEAKSALKDAGCVEVGLMLAQIDPAPCDVSDDGDVSGLDTQIKELKRTYPRLFETPKKPDIKTVGGGNKEKAPAEKKGSASVLAARLGHGE